MKSLFFCLVLCCLLSFSSQAPLVATWGFNSNGQIGDGTLNQRISPFVITSLANPTYAASGEYHSFAVLTGGNLYAWGFNAQGQLGDGTTVDKSTPVLINALGGVKAATGGSGHSLALLTSGAIYGWGDNTYGQVGDGTMTQRNLPVFLTSGPMIDISAGNLHSVALSSTGVVYVWGDNFYGQLGTGNNVQMNSPTALATLDAIQISAHGDHTLVLLRNGNVASWGANPNGEVGDGTVINRNTPFVIPTLANIIAIAAGGSHSLALSASGAVSSWGDNTNGQLGDGTTTPRTTPGAVSGLTGVTKISAGYGFSLALSATGTVSAWGYNGNGQLGDGTTTQRTTPVAVTGLTGITGISAGNLHSSAFTASISTTQMQTTLAQTTAMQTTRAQTTQAVTTQAVTTQAQTTQAQTTADQTTAIQTTAMQTTIMQTTQAQTTAYWATCANRGFTCSSTQNCVDNRITTPPTPSCVCKPGYTLDKTNPRNCIAVGSLPGFGDSCATVQCKPQFQCIDNTCKCAYGQFYRASTDTCEVIRVPAGVTDSSCSGWGDIHWTDFTGVAFDHQATCDVLVAKNNFIEVQVRSWFCSSNQAVVCTGRVGIMYEGTRFILDQTGAYQNGVLITTLPATIGTATISRVGARVTFKFTYGTVIYDYNYIQVLFFKLLSGITTGLCGNWTIGQRTAFMARGDVAIPRTNPNGFSSTWAVDSAQGDTLIFPNPTNPATCRRTKRDLRTRSVIDDTCTDVEILGIAAELCNPILGLADTFNSLDVASFWEACMYDICATNDTTFAEQSLSAAIQTANFTQSFIPPDVTTAAFITGSVTGSGSVTGAVSSASTISTFISFFVAFLFSFFFLCKE